MLDPADGVRSGGPVEDISYCRQNNFIQDPRMGGRDGAAFRVPR